MRERHYRLNNSRLMGRSESNGAEPLCAVLRREIDDYGLSRMVEDHFETMEDAS
ncbi:hypothetical protein K0M31_009410 [Melipona bicolor]|uniref:Uncharacterized protein n=1 Tax=Melipona bicolor TaxID=60889 RepID=A0AA40FNT0_9HYME|nr:hypothetical protein K0M31_009410 [Melipona bicolor]